MFTRKHFLCLMIWIHLLAGTVQGQRIVTGAERMDQYLPLLTNKRVALLVNQTSVVAGRNLVDTLLKRGVHIVKIFSPEHGFRGMASAGEQVHNSTDSVIGLPVISLYGEGHYKPSAADLQDVDILVYDIQDVGVRFYTYISSLQYLMEAAAEHHLPLLVLDRPNPNGFYVDGPVLDTAFRSFVGMQPIPIVYGMTVGEYARMLNGEGWLAHHDTCALTVIPCLHYTHDSLYQLPVPPSPNLRTMNAVYLYPSLCLFEGTVISVGRGTDHPFEVFGHPNFPHRDFQFTPQSRPGAMHPLYENQICYGFSLIQSPEKTLKQINHHLQLKWLIQAYTLYPDRSHFFNAYFPKLAGNAQLQKQIMEGMSEKAIQQSWKPALDQFLKIRAKYLLYP
ncbi:Uncharacterized conserved protein YbbC, DUF1343 family [Thermoflavifilum thermophilum]|uniref:Uncharacterized conserved protein YbbC, DUF1343 family n=2 Tax=Thermoflavifilum thermophilum TaxID=1393122 RepID=A0A1I7NMM1_9BACT|nr:Uncharacterized conserved protein YbbC, DUF1343 family [Thermoflavifilum thermophilum]